MAVLDIPTLTDCECQAKVYADHSGADIEFCDLHRLAPGLLAEANKTIRDLENRLARLQQAARSLLDAERAGYLKRDNLALLDDLRKLLGD